jgi:Ca-activated chloride channel family protein
MPDDGHRADRAIAWSQGLMRQAGFARGQILLLTDRADGTDIDAASEGERRGLSRVGAGPRVPHSGGVFDTPEGLGQARLDALRT